MVGRPHGTCMRVFRRYSVQILAGLVIAASAAIFAYLQITVRGIEENLPLTVMEQKVAVDQMVRRLEDLTNALSIARIDPGEQQLERARASLVQAQAAAEGIRTSYNFDNLVGAAAIHQVVNPALMDIANWIDNGVSIHPPTSPLTLRLMETRAEGAMRRARQLGDAADRSALEIVSEEAKKLSRLRSEIIVPLTFIGLLAIGIVVLLLRQARAERRRLDSETLARSAERRLLQAMEAAEDGFALFDADDRFVFCNARYRSLPGAVPETLVPGTPYEQLLWEVVRRGVVPEAVGREEEWVTWRMQHHRNPKEPIMLRLSDQFIQVRETILGDGATFVVASDVTSSRFQAEEMRRAKEEAELASRAKSEFLALMSHELRTPLNAVIGFAELIKGEMFGPINNPRYLEYIAVIHASGQHLLELINDILDLSKIEAGRYALMESSLDLPEVFEEVLPFMSDRMRLAGLRWDVDIPKTLPLLWADRRAIKQIALNLLSNAVKFTPEGGLVGISVFVDAESAVVMRFSDTGIGIAPEHMQKVLEPFGQAENTLARRHEGTGLGLPLVKALMELHGGTLHLDSVLDQGTTVTLRFDPARSRQKQEALAE